MMISLMSECRYIDPQVIRKKVLPSEASDMFSFGVIMSEMLTGEPTPWRAREVVQSKVGAPTRVHLVTRIMPLQQLPSMHERLHAIGPAEIFLPGDTRVSVTCCP